jgi:hypothetical protein
VDRLQQLVDQKVFDGQATETEKGAGVFITTPLASVFAYLDDPANSDVFLKAAQYQRMTKQ